MRLLSVLPRSPPIRPTGGAERQTHSLHADLRALGLDVHVLADARALGRKHVVHDGVEIWAVPPLVLTSNRWRLGNLKNMRALSRMRKTVIENIGRPDAILTSPLRETALCADALAGTFGVPWIARVAGRGPSGDFAYMQNNWQTREAMPGLVARVAAVIVFDEPMRDEAISYGVAPSRLHLIRSALAIEIPDAASVSGPRDRIVFVGRVAPEKRLETLVAGYACFRARRRDAADLDIVGGGGDLASCRATIERLDVRDHVTLHGDQGDVVPYLARAACYVSASETEGFPNAVLEACAMGTPVILSNIFAHREIARAVGAEEFLFGHEDPEALADALERFFALPPGRREDLSARAIAYASQFSREKRNRAYLDLLRKLTGAV